MYCKHKTSLVRCSDYFREQYYAFRNQLGALVKIRANEKFVRMCVCDIGIVEQYKACCPCHFVFSSELDMSVSSTSFKFNRLYSIPLMASVTRSIRNLEGKVFVTENTLESSRFFSECVYTERYEVNRANKSSKIRIKCTSNNV